MRSQWKSGRHIDETIAGLRSARSLGRFSRRGVFPAALGLAAACLFAAPIRLAAQQTLYWSDSSTNLMYSAQISGSTSSNQITYASGAGIPTTGAFNSPRGIAFDQAGNLYVADSGNGQLVQVGPGGDANSATYTVVAQGLSAPKDVAVDRAGNLYVTDGNNEVLQFSPGSGGSFTQSTWLAGSSISAPSYTGQLLFGLAITANGTMYIGTAAASNDVILQTTLSNPSSVSLFTNGSDTPAGSLEGATSIAIDSSGNVWAPNFYTGVINEFSPTGVYMNQITGLTDPESIVFDAQGDLWAGDVGVGKIDEYSTAAGSFGTLIQQISSAQPRYLSFGFAIPTPPSGTEWNGTGVVGTGSWADTHNWTGGVVPGKIAANAAAATNTDTVLFDTYNSTNPAPVVDAGRNVQSITFDNTLGNLTGSITLGTTTGNPLLLTSGGTIQTTGSVTLPQTVNAPLVLAGGGTYTFQSGAGTSTATLSFGGAITAGATSGTTTLALAGINSGANTISGAIGNGSSTVALSVQGGAWVLTGANSYTGATAVSGGSLRLGAGGSLGNTSISVTAGTLTFAAGSTLGSNSVSVSGGSATVAGGATVGNAAFSATGTGSLVFQPGSGTLLAGSTGAGTGGATLSIGSGTTFSMVDGSVGELFLNQQNSFAGNPALSLNGGTLNFELGNTGADRLLLNTGSAAVSGTNTINFIGVGPNLTIGATYPVISAPAGGLTGMFQFPGGVSSAIVSAGSTLYSLTLNNTSTAVTVSVAAGPPLIISDAFPQSSGTSIVGTMPSVANVPGGVWHPFGTNGPTATAQGGGIVTLSDGIGANSGVAIAINSNATNTNPAHLETITFNNPNVLTISAGLRVNFSSAFDTSTWRGAGLGFYAAAPVQAFINNGTNFNQCDVFQGMAIDIGGTGSVGGGSGTPVPSLTNPTLDVVGTTPAVPPGAFYTTQNTNGGVQGTQNVALRLAVDWNSLSAGGFSNSNFYTLTYMINMTTGVITNVTLTGSSGSEGFPGPIRFPISTTPPMEIR